MAGFDIVELIIHKRDGGELTGAQIDWLIAAYTQGEVAEEQFAALAMAIYFTGLSRVELARWTEAMVNSGERLRHRVTPTVDKHSTGGVGDKITLPLTPLVAACGIAVPQLSGRGLGHTGGTLDKLEAIPGWQAELDNDRIAAQLAEVGAVICAAAAELAPADKKLYALRDVTGTVESIPLIASSIMSKKIAEGTDGLVLDVKVGSGAFMKTRDGAAELATAMVDLGADAGVATVALLTDMDTPLGHTAGNALEVAEAVEVLAGGGPDDVRELTLALAREMVQLAGVDVDPEQVLDSGQAMDRWRTLITAQSGDPDARLPTARHTDVITATESGFCTRLDAYPIGIAARRLGAGRTRRGEPVQAAAGVTWHVRPGDPITIGQSLFTLHTDTADRLESGREALTDAITIDTDPTGPVSLIIDRIPSAH